MPPRRRGNAKAPSLSTRKPPTAATTNPSIPKENNSVEESVALETYQEPPVLDQPSYLEYKGIPRSQVLDDMLPLGTFPTNAIKSRIKAPKPSESMRLKARAKKPGKSAVKEQVGSAESSQPLVTPQSTDSLHPMITRKRSQSHKTQGETQPSTRPASRVPENPIPGPSRSASLKHDDPVSHRRRSASRKLLESNPSARSESRKPQDPNSSSRRSASRKSQNPISSISRSESFQPAPLKSRSQSRKIEERHLLTRRSQSRALENQNDVVHRSQSLKSEDRKTQLRLSVEKKDDEDDVSKEINNTSSLKTVPAPSSAYSGPNSRTSAGQRRLKQVVDAAVQRSIETGDSALGLAIKKLYEDSLQDRTLAELLDGVLSHPTPQQTEGFQAFIKVARKQIKAETSSARHSSQSTRPTSSRRTGIRKASSDVSGKSKIPSKAENPSTLPQDSINNTDIISTEEGNPPERVKTSRSISTSSSLSSLPSLDQELSPTAKEAQAKVTQPIANPLTVEQSPLAPNPNRVLNISHARDISPEPSAEDSNERARELEEAEKKYKKKDFSHVIIQESNVRDEPHPFKQRQVLPAKPKPALTLTQPRPPMAASRKRKHDDEDSIHSATSSHGELLIPPPPGARATSRGTTPNPSGRPTKRVKTARVKMSPDKKRKFGVTGIIGRTGSRKGAKVNYTEEIEVDNNDDACAACGGIGKLLCCDNCPSAFHFSCVDPPLDEENPPEGEWLCNKCKSKHDYFVKKPRGLFSNLLDNMQKQNPSVFSLPRELRDHYEGVKTGEKGEYVDYTEVGLKTKAKTYEEAKAEALRLKDKAGKTILCCSCRQSALGGRLIISCDYCPSKWHLDCLDPPRASIPYKQPSGDPRHTWMCPNHVEHELRAIDLSIKATGEPNPNGKLYKLRKPKHPRIIEPAISRGISNNGLIEIINDPSDEEDDEITNQGPPIYRITERGIKLDFIDKMRRVNEEEERKQARKLAAANEAFNKHSFIDRQAALNLASFASSNQDLGLKPRTVGELTRALIAEAPDNVVSLFMREEEKEKGARLSTIPEEETTDAPAGLAPSYPSAEKSMGGTEKQTLELLQELIRRRLEAVASSR